LIEQSERELAERDERLHRRETLIRQNERELAERNEWLQEREALMGQSETHSNNDKFTVQSVPIGKC
jgi:hypothetical protein